MTPKHLTSAIAAFTISTLSVIPHAVIQLNPAIAQTNPCNEIRPVTPFSATAAPPRVNIRSSPAIRSDNIIGSIEGNGRRTFDASTYGTPVDDVWLSKPGAPVPDARWYRLQGKVQGRDGWVASGVVYGNPNPAPPRLCSNPADRYYPELSSLTDAQWDEYSGDNTRFDPQWWDGGVDERNKTPNSIKQIYTDLSVAIFGQRRPMNTGYLYDRSYYNYYLKWHAGFDMGATPTTQVKTVVGGTTYLIQNQSGNYFMTVKGDDGNLWIYGHLGSLSVANGARIDAGRVVGTIGSQNHLHLEVQPGHTYKGTEGAHSNQNFVRNSTISPLQAFWRLKNR